MPTWITCIGGVGRRLLLRCCNCFVKGDIANIMKAWQTWRWNGWRCNVAPNGDVTTILKLQRIWRCHGHLPTWLGITWRRKVVVVVRCYCCWSRLILTWSCRRLFSLLILTHMLSLSHATPRRAPLCDHTCTLRHALLLPSLHATPRLWVVAIIGLTNLGNKLKIRLTWGFDQVPTWGQLTQRDD